jgi:hypothetical protein
VVCRTNREGNRGHTELKKKKQDRGEQSEQRKGEREKEATEMGNRGEEN